MAPGGVSPDVCRSPGCCGGCGEGTGLSPGHVPVQFHCCGSNNSQDWRDSEWILSGEAGDRVVPDSCCKTVVAGCGRRDHASNIYKVEVGRWGPWHPGCWRRVSPHPRGPGLGKRPPLPSSRRSPPLPPQGGCITRLETFIREHLRIIGAVGIGIACVQVRARGGAGAGHGAAWAQARAHAGSWLRCSA